MQVNKFLVLFLIVFACCGMFAVARDLISPPDYTMSAAQAMAYCGQ